MAKLRTKIKAKLSAHVAKRRESKKAISTNLIIAAIALAAGLGYVAGTNHYQIEAAIGPVFGYRAHSGTIDLTSLEETYNELASNFDGKLDKTKLIQGANRGLVEAAGDEYTMYMSPSEAEDYDNSLTGNIGGGIGAEIGLKNGKVTIMSVLADNPAIRVGLQSGDIVLSINDQSTSGYSATKAVSLIRGEEGTTVKLTIQRGDETKEYSITRAIINNPSVRSEISGDLGTITISRFDDKTGDLARGVAQDFVNKGVKNIILDLRNNPGGFVDTAVDVAGLWLDNKVVVTERVNGIIITTEKSGSNALLAGIETVVLVNGESASASEIVAGALQDHKAAKLVGETTYGKGSVQRLIDLNGGALLKVTIASWYTPNGVNITKEGIKPDTTATLTQEDVDKDVDPQIDAAKKLLGL